MSEHWKPNRRGMPKDGALSADDLPVQGPRVRVPSRIWERFKAASAAAGYPHVSHWMIARLQEAADRDLPGEG